MRPPRSRNAGLWLLAGLGGISLMACTEGVGRPFVLASIIEDAGHDSASDEGEPDAAPTGISDASPPSKTKDASPSGPKLPAVCEQLEDNWPDSADREARKLLDALNNVRMTRSQRCRQRAGPIYPIMEHPALKCAARLRLFGQPLQRKPNPPYVEALTQQSDPRDIARFFQRLADAEFAPERALGELVVWNANNVESAVNAIIEEDYTCDYVTPPYVNLIGIAKVEHVWALEFGTAGTFPGPGGHP